MRPNPNVLWEIEKAQEALEENEPRLALRYLSKAMEGYRCMYCHQVPDERPDKPYFKGWIHDECKEKI